MEKFDLSAIVSKENPWTLKPWHIRAAFRRSGIIVPEEAIEMPPKEIKGPDMSIEQKEFYVTVTVRCSSLLLKVEFFVLIKLLKLFYIIKTCTDCIMKKKKYFGFLQYC